MTLVLQPRPASLFDLAPAEVEAIEPGLHSAAPTAARDGGPTLEALLSGVWEGLAARRTVACPICDGPLTPIHGADGSLLGGGCRGCGMRLD